ncbi:MAG: hypothetical protein RL213_1105 [Bacteroidota bacterium]|jgi:hypothetical protein
MESVKIMKALTATDRAGHQAYAFFSVNVKVVPIP